MMRSGRRGASPFPAAPRRPNIASCAHTHTIAHAMYGCGGSPNAAGDATTSCPGVPQGPGAPGAGIVCTLASARRVGHAAPVPTAGRTLLLFAPNYRRQVFHTDAYTER